MSPHLARTIIRDPYQLSGRWHLAGTKFAVAEIRLDHAARGTEDGYRFPGVTAAELTNCLAFVFPPIRESRVALTVGTAVVACACGEDTPVIGSLLEPVACVCGRKWRISLILEPIEEASIPASSIF
jgi:uncharacterized protein (DUF433 family)